MIRVIIVEDEKEEAERLEEALHQYAQSHGTHFEITVYHSGVRMLDSYHNNADLIFMDIELDTEEDTAAGINGMDVAVRIREKDTRVGIVFVTNMAQMAIRGYEVQALDFIVKPVSYYSLELKLGTLLTRIERREVILAVQTGASIHKISSRRLRYVEVAGHELCYHCGDVTLQQRFSLHALEKELEGLPFYRCNNCYLVNLDYVDGIENDDVIVDGEHLKMSRPRRRAFTETYAAYLGGLL
jgi:DNA-binding LytR/AlgR family response regulator